MELESRSRHSLIFPLAEADQMHLNYLTNVGGICFRTQASQRHASFPCNTPPYADPFLQLSLYSQIFLLHSAHEISISGYLPMGFPFLQN